MSSRQSGRRGRGKNPGVNRQINNALRANHLTGIPGWYLIKSGQNDPPPYNDDAVYARKVRKVVATVADGGYAITPINLTSALGFSASTFKYITLTRVDVWGIANQNGIKISIAPNSGPNGDRDFVDYGVSGSRRPHVAVGISPRDQTWYTTAATTVICVARTLSAVGVEIAGQVIIDAHVQFRGIEVTGPILGSPVLGTVHSDQDLEDQLELAADERKAYLFG
jgi:hypothetical protein